MEEFIEAVRNYPVLYDLSHEDYMRIKLKDEIWEKLVYEFKLENGKAAKEQWRKLKDCYRDAMRRRKKKSGQAGTVIRPWVYQKAMEFLQPYMANRTTISNMSLDSQGEMSQANYENLDDTQILEMDTIEETEDLRPCEQPTKKAKTDVPQLILKELKERSVLRENKKLELLELKNKLVNEEKSDGLLQFFMSMYNSTKSMPMHSQLKVKREIFNVVMDEEEKNLHLNSNVINVEYINEYE